MKVLAYLSLVTTILTYVFCIIVFGDVNDNATTRKWCFSIFIIKAIIWSPYVGLEYYDMCFEHLYHDVQFQLNVVKPYNGQSYDNSANASLIRKPVQHEE